MKIVQAGPDRLSIVPETEFETEHLGRMFYANEDRAVVVKSGLGIGDLMSVDVVVTNVKCPITIPDTKCGCDEGEGTECCLSEIKLAPNSLKNLVKEG
jgi:hypothetical protein